MPLPVCAVARSLCWTGLIPLLVSEVGDERAINSASNVAIVDIGFPFRLVT
jgi:hypothetical protein